MMRLSLFGLRMHQRQSRFKSIFWSIISIIILTSVVYLFIFSPIFQITKIQIQDQNSQPDLQIENIVKNIISQKKFFILPQNNYFLLPKQDIEQKINDLVVPMKSINIKRKIFHTLEIYLEKRKEEIIVVFQQYKQPEPLIPIKQAEEVADKDREEEILATDYEFQPEEIELIQEAYYLTDNSGYILEKLKPTDLELKNDLLYFYMEKVIDENQDGEFFDPQIGEYLIDENVFSKIVSTPHQIRTKTGLAVQNINFKLYEPNTLAINTIRGVKLYFDLGDDIKSQVEALKIVLDERIKDKIKEIEYVDLRLTPRVHYK